MQPRHAVYFAPRRDTLLAERAARWLGRDAWEDRPLAQPSIEGVSAERFRAITESARHYGFHATLKAPFTLADGVGEQDLLDAVARLARGRAPFDLPVRLGDLSGFVCLLQREPSEPLRELADACVIDLDPFRAPLDERDMARRVASGLDARGMELLRTWGYHHVLERFVFHMTLTDRLAATELALLSDAARRELGACLAEPVRIDAVCVFSQPDRRSPFKIIARHALGADVEGDFVDSRTS